MSLINQMLRDLDARQAEGDAQALPGQTVALPAQAGRPRTGILLGGLCLGAAMLAAAGWFWLQPQASSPASPTLASGVPQARLTSDTAVAQSASVTPATTQIASSVPSAVIPESPSARENPVQSSGEPQPVSPTNSKPLVRVAPVSHAFPSSAASAIQLKLDELLTFNVRSRGNEKDALATGGGEAVDRSSIVAKSARPDAPEKGGAWEKTDKPASETGTLRIEKIDRHDPGAGLYQNGLEALRQGRLKDAIEQLQFALRENPKLIAARQTLLRVYVDQRDWDEAQSLLREGLALMPDQAGWAMGLARIQVERGQSEQAWETLQKYDALAGRNADYQGFAGVLLQHMKKPHEAAERYRAALKLRPREGRWWYALGTALEEDGQATEAMEIYRRALALGGLTPSMAESIEKKLK